MTKVAGRDEEVSLFICSMYSYFVMKSVTVVKLPHYKPHIHNWGCACRRAMKIIMTKVKKLKKYVFCESLIRIRILLHQIFPPILRVEAKVDLIASYNCLCQNVNHRLTRSSFFPNITNHPKESSDLAPVFHEITRCRIHRW